MKANRVSVPAHTLAPARAVVARALIGTLLVLSGCVPGNPPPPAAPPPPPPARTTVAAPAPPAAPADWRDAPQTPGTWRWARQDGRSTASYGLPGQPPVVTLACDPATANTILWTNRPASGPVPLTVTATSTRRLLTANPAAPGGTAITLPAGDRLNDAMAFSRGRFMLEVAGFPALYLPAWTEVGRVVEDCRAGG